MRCSQQNDREVHAEVEHLEDLRLGQAQDQDAAKLGQCDAAEHLWTGEETGLAVMGTTSLDVEFD